MLTPQSISNQKINYPLWEDRGIEVWIKRLDQVHPLASGNKFFKLKYNLERAISENHDTILTFGGAYSNHIYATAAAAKSLGLHSIGIIRGEETLPLNPTLASAKENGMRVDYVDREAYRRKTEPEFLQALQEKFGNFYLIPEGGNNAEAIKGTSEILEEKDSEFTHITCSIGTGGTFTGLVNSIEEQQTLLGFSSLKGDFIHEEIKNLLKSHQVVSKGKYQILDQFHFGGYGKVNADLIEFVKWFYKEFEIVLEPIYTGKMIYGLFEMIKNKTIESNSKILIIHTGGLQGLAGFNHRFGTSLPL
ncbi:1-aminocyclopropane-1-carboxylate deaminase [Belliella baltica DSM 15883]|uniref:1-aminocyclopropane-1-carboxylate deaminase n=1 Tax=Belliella baltica (strain DSM 15883 / CIP 108006 / LMG 21964 / BA134) TaxID=866536 RepID=I3Z3Y1_BELBD|nr:pyridoxal-phosphate dependent enzyme [Belliella baltica]AFL83949.1 1-aminocyclopropane-1-carboxylate deaminase [Belliella baltica DSM 15883]